MPFVLSVAPKARSRRALVAATITSVARISLTRQRDPGRRMIAGLGQIAHPAVDAGLAQARRQFRVEQDVVDAQPGVALPVIAEVIPEGIDALLRMLGTQGVDPALLEQAEPGSAALRLQQRVATPVLG